MKRTSIAFSGGQGNVVGQNNVQLNLFQGLAGEAKALLAEGTRPFNRNALIASVFAFFGIFFIYCL
jgi:hypothetical protein